MLVTVGGIIPDDDVAPLKAEGVAAVFGPGTTIREVADFIRGQREAARVAGPAGTWPRPRRRAPTPSPMPHAPATGARWPAC